MANCAYCNTGILFGGVSDGANRYCNEKCQTAGYLISLADQVPPEKIDELVESTRNGECPKCRRHVSTVDVYMAHRIWSILVMTSWSSHPELSCKGCATKRQLGSVLFCGALGWWGFPWGLIGTPVQIIRNFASMAKTPKSGSPLLHKYVKVMLGQQIAAELHAREQQAQA